MGFAQERVRLLSLDELGDGHHPVSPFPQLRQYRLQRLNGLHRTRDVVVEQDDIPVS